MKKIFLLAIFTLFSLGLFSLNANAHPSKKHKPLVCIPEEDRTEEQLKSEKNTNFFQYWCSKAFENYFHALLI